MSTSVESWSTDGGIELRVLVARLRARKLWLLVSVVVFTALFTTAALIMTPRYRAVTVMVDASVGRTGTGLGSALGQLGGLASLAGINLGNGGDSAEESMAVLRSREFTERFMKDEHAMQDLFNKRWDAAAGRWRGGRETWPTPAQAYRYFDSSVREISRDKQTGLIKLEILWKDPVKAAQWANVLVARLNEEMRRRAVASSTASIGYLEQELARTSAVETRQAINRLMETQINQRMLATVTREYAFRVVDRALPPDPRNIAKPNKLLLFVLGPLIGLFVGAFVVLLAHALDSGRRP